MTDSDVPDLAVLNSVLRLTAGLLENQMDEGVIHDSLKYGDSEVCTQTGRKDWSISDPRWHMAVEAANYFAASNLLPKTVADQQSGTPLFVTYIKLGNDIINRINQGIIDGLDDGIIVIESTGNRNYYVNPDYPPYMGVDAFGGRNYWNNVD